MAFATTVPLWGVMLSAAVPLVGLIAWLAVLGNRVKALEIEFREIGKINSRMSVMEAQLARVNESLEWIKERLAGKH